MTQFYPGPYEVEIFYTEATLTHIQRLNCTISAEGAVGDPFSAFSVTQRNGVNVALNTAVDAWIAVIRAIFNATTNFTIANLYKYVPDSFDKAFLATYDINQVGSGVNPAQLNHETMLTFTTQLGNNMKLVFLEDANALVTRIPIRDASAQIQAIANYAVGPTGWMHARDGSYAAGKLNSVQGQNEAVFKKRNR